MLESSSSNSSVAASVPPMRIALNEGRPGAAERWQQENGEKVLLVAMMGSAEGMRGALPLSPPHGNVEQICWMWNTMIVENLESSRSGKTGVPRGS